MSSFFKKWILFSFVFLPDNVPLLTALNTFIYHLIKLIYVIQFYLDYLLVWSIIHQQYTQEIKEETQSKFKYNGVDADIEDEATIET